MRFRWLPWKFIVRYAARSHGFLDPINLMSQLQRFIQPSEVTEPVELLRAGALMHARGLINNRVIQHNLDWVWPYWIERQFDPQDISFIPRAFSITHINLSHRNWTAIGLPDHPELPIVDPRGLLTPVIDGWSIDVWLVTKNGRTLLPSKSKQSEQKIVCEDELRVVTTSQCENLKIISQAYVLLKEDEPNCHLDIEAFADEEAWVAVSLRPCNPEGVSFVYELSLNDKRDSWLIDDKYTVKFSSSADRHHISNYKQGDVHIHLDDLIDERHGECPIGMLTAAAMFKLDKSIGSRRVSVRFPLQQSAKNHIQHLPWHEHLQHASCLQIPEQSFQSLYNTALRTLLLHSSEDIYPGPYTYKRFWFRDAVFIIHALLCAGLTKRAEQAIDKFSSRQDFSGYFHSQEGEWDSNGEVVWILYRFCQLSHQKPKAQWLKMIRRGADWIINKRLPKTHNVHSGLLPAGFSAEHLGPNDYYYWDNFWGIAGLRAASELFALTGDATLAKKYSQAATDFQLSVDQSLERAVLKLKRPAMPAAPERRLDAGSIGSLALGYPTQLCAEDDIRLLDTCDFLLDNCCVENGFFQDMTHSGINPYLTLHISQVLMRAGDVRYAPLMQRVADLATSTGQWPEAIHPLTGGGCMGDGQHVWAAAEWVMMLRNCFIREEANCLVIGAGVSEQWLASGQVITFGPAATSFGQVKIMIEPQTTLNTTTSSTLSKTTSHRICWQADWHGEAPLIEVRLPGQATLKPAPTDNSVICGYQA
ncbi:MAG: hypothetical protein ACI88A_004622 [Paraglaciecola sp.]|jgi:hypothetical protein